MTTADAIDWIYSYMAQGMSFSDAFQSVLPEIDRMQALEVKRAFEG